MDNIFFYCITDRGLEKGMFQAIAYRKNDLKSYHFIVFCLNQDMKTFDEWLQEFISINSNPKVGAVGYPLTREQFYKVHFPSDFNPKNTYAQEVRIQKELEECGAITKV